MQFTTVGKLKEKIQGKMHGTTLNKVAGVYDKLSEAAGNIVMRISPISTIKRYRIENAIYDKVYSYLIADDFKGNDSVVDLRPIGPRSNKDSIGGRFSQEFDIKKEVNTLQVEMINGVKTLRLSKRLKPHTVLCKADSLTLDGAVTSTGDVTELSIDTLDYISGSGSVSAELSGITGVASIIFNLNNPIDLSSLENLGSLFNWINFSDATKLTSVTLKFGNSGSSYWSKTVTAPHDRANFESLAWTLQMFEWNEASITGTPDSSAIDYVEVSVVYTAGTAQTMKVDNITASLGQAYEIIYYSNCLFRGVDGTWKSVPTDDTDFVMLDPEAFNIMLYEASIIFGQEIKGKNMSNDLKYFSYQLEGDGRSQNGSANGKPGLYQRYEEKYPSQAIPLQSTYYEFGTIGNDFADDDDKGYINEY